VGTLLVLWGLITHGTHAGTGDEPHYQMIAHSLVFDGDLDLANDYSDASNLVFGGRLEPEGHAVHGRGGALRPIHDIGLPLVSAPYFAVAYKTAQLAALHLPGTWLAQARLNSTLILRHLLSLAMAAVAAWIAIQLFELFAVAAPPLPAMGWAALLVLSPPLLSHAFLFFPEVPSAAVALWVFCCLHRPLLSLRAAPWLGVATGGLLLLHVRNAGLVVGLTYLALDRTRRTGHSRFLALFVVGLSAAIAMRTLVNYTLWGTFLTTPHVRLHWPVFSSLATEISTRLLGWVLDREHGLLAYAPIYLLVPVGWVALRRRDRELCWQLSVLVATYVSLIALPFVNPHGWRGGWSPAVRFLVPVVPFLAILVFAAARSKPRMQWAVGGLVVLQVVLNAFLWQHPKLLWNDGNGTSAFLNYLDSGTGYLSRLFPSFVGPG
jgi:hypothetical protein